MARKLSTRKRPSREEYTLREQLKIEEGVFDNRTMMMLGKLFTRNVITSVNHIVKRGKEADVYLADPGSKTAGAEQVIIKIFRVETSSFSSRINYIHGDPRFKGIGSSRGQIISTWCKKEYGNLKIAEEAKVHSPRPYSFIGNVLAMEFIGEDTVPANTLKESGTEDPQKTLGTLIGDMRKLYQSELVHGDISEYNILMKGSMPYIIDFGQAVTLGHPKAVEMLSRDVTNLCSFFAKRYKIEADQAELLKKITGAD